MSRFLIILSFSVLALTGCKKDKPTPPNPKPPKPPVGNLTGVNKWIYEDLEKWYYWNDAVKEATPPSNSLDYDDFLQTLVLSLKDAQDDSENPPTMDGGYDSDGDRFVYSYIERTSVSTRTNVSEATTFGFDIVPFGAGTDAGGQLIAFLVTWVREDSPADEAGLKRGMWITKYKDQAIHFADYEEFFYQLNYLQGGNTMNFTDEDRNEYTLTAVSMTSTPILVNKVVETKGKKKVAYLMYNQFDTGTTDRYGNGVFDDQLRDVFGEFKRAGVDELVVDLRYNPGGAVSSCRILTSLAADVGPSQVFCKLLHNSELAAQNNWANPDITNFLTEANSLDLERVWVLATNQSASASEMFINSLQGVGIDVRHIGTRTEGKNVGMNLREHTEGGYKYEMWPITFKIFNAADYCDYAGGLTPDLEKNEFWDVIDENGSGIVHELGDPKERLLEAALTMIDGGTVAPDVRTRAGDPSTIRTPIPNKLRDPRKGGAKIR